MRKLGLLVVMLMIGSGTATMAADFNGDGTGDIAIFRESSGLWAIRGVTRVYFGGSGDNVVPGDYNGNGTDQPSIFRPASGLWAARGVTRVYFGGGSDEAKPGDYNGDGIYDIGIFRGSSGLWAIKGITRAYFGTSGDVAIAAGKAGGSGGGGLLKTGQTTSYRTGDDGTYRTGTAFSYQTSDPAANGEIVTSDNVTGLMWAADGTGAGCYSGGTRTWTQAIDWAVGLSFAGQTDWRLPNRRELESIVDSGRHIPAINTVYFLNTVPAYYWSSTTDDSNTSRAWDVDFYDGNVNGSGKTSNGYVRAVRGGE